MANDKVIALPQSKMDWAMLRKQKLWLIEQAEATANPNADGLIHLLDAIQDHAVDSGIASELEVFATS